MTGVLDYGIGNIGSILNMIKKVGAQGAAVRTAEELSRCDRLILPGVGRFDAGMALLCQSGMRRALDRAVAQGVPLLGICLGMQMLGRRSEEGPGEGLGYPPFDLKRFRLQDQPELKVPHMGWDYVTVERPQDPLVAGLEAEPRFALRAQLPRRLRRPRGRADDLRLRLPLSRRRGPGKRLGHAVSPEKSHRFGMCLIRNFVKEA